MNELIKQLLEEYTLEEILMFIDVPDEEVLELLYQQGYEFSNVPIGVKLWATQI